MKKVIKLLFAALPIVASCNSGVSKEAYKAYVINERNHLKKNIEAGEMTYKIQYRPAEFIALTEQGDTASLSSIQKRASAIKGTVWFNISFQMKSATQSVLRFGAVSNEDYELRLKYFLSDAGKDICLVCAKDTLARIGYLFENNFNLTPHETMVVGFSLPGNMVEPTEDLQLIYNDRCFNNGIIKATISLADIKRIPNLIF